ncbi:pyridoxamine 5'-phosphate oxidase family protein [Nocardioides sp.]|uniref:pyridoxamine 5'-phosphate oxidase family protein n=1 Tax=Nocardioides sp. TaxID=35761 RepID=UPI0039E3725E
MAELIELDVDESWDLAGEQGLCRIGWSSGSGPVILPVNHVIHDRTLWIRTSAYSSLVKEVDDTPVAVLVDSIDPETHVGWSVQLRGVAHVHFHTDTVPEDVQRLRTWPDGPRPLWIELAGAEVTGRRLD